MSEELRDWITQELKKRHWSRRELARQTDLSPAIVQKTLKGERNPSSEFCVKVAQTLGESPEKLLRMAGILPQVDETLTHELSELIANLDRDQKLEVLRYVRYLATQSKDNR